MSPAWDYSANERSADGKFSTEFDGLDLAVGSPSLGELRPYASAELLRGGLNLQSGLNGDASAQMQGLNLKRKESYGEDGNVKFS